jgi:hypothetical protein
MKRVYISIDYNHDSDLKILLFGQSKHPDTDFEIADYSIKEHLSGDWKEQGTDTHQGLRSRDCNLW